MCNDLKFDAWFTYRFNMDLYGVCECVKTIIVTVFICVLMECKISFPFQIWSITSNYRSMTDDCIKNDNRHTLKFHTLWQILYTEFFHKNRANNNGDNKKRLWKSSAKKKPRTSKSSKSEKAISNKWQNRKYGKQAEKKQVERKLTFQTRTHLSLHNTEIHTRRFPTKYLNIFRVRIAPHHPHSFSFTHSWFPICTH